MPTDSSATPAPAAAIVDLRPLMRPQRHATVFAALDQLGGGETFILINDHAPIPLLQHIEATWPGCFSFEWLLDGPRDWQVAITRAAGS